MTVTLLKSLLDNQIYNKYNSVLSFNDSTMNSIYDSIKYSHSKFNKNLSVDELKEIHYTLNPTLSQAKIQNLDILFDSIKETDISSIVSEDIIKNKIKNDAFEQIAALSIDAAEGKDNYQQIQNLLDKVRGEVLVETSNLKLVTDDLDELIEESRQVYKWTYPLKSLQDALGGIGAGVLGLIAARPNAGKTAFVVSLAYHPNGFAAQGAKVALFGTEEPAWRTKLRGVSCYTGIPATDFVNNEELKKKVKAQYSAIAGRVVVQDAVGVHISEVESYIRKHTPDILMIDVIDKIRIDGVFKGEHDRLQELYLQMRELAKRYGIAILGTCQASSDAEGKMYFGLNDLVGSKTGKGGEVDVCICIGKEGFGQNEDTGYRTANIAKNKITGIEKPVAYMLDRNLSRIYN